MRTQQQDVVAEKSKLADLKEDYLKAISRYTETMTDEDALQCQQSGARYFNHAEEFVGNSDLLGAHSSAIWAQGFAEDCAAMLEQLPNHIELLRLAFGRSQQLANVPYALGPTAYANMQRMVARYLNRELITELREKLKSAGIPTYGFDHKAKNVMQRDKLLAFGFGVTFIIVLIIIALTNPDPSQFQYTIFRVVLSLAAAGVGAVIPGTISVTANRWVRAGGAIAMFVIVYFFAPAAL